MIINDLNLKRFFVKIQKDVVPLLGEDGLADNIQAARGLTALFLATEAGMPPNEANTYVVDQGEDLGIDGLYFNPSIKVLYVVQSKFKLNQEKTITQGEILKFLEGVKRILRFDTENANQKFKNAYKEIKPALEDISTKIKLCIVSTSKNDLPLNCEKPLDDFCRQQNEMDEIFSFHYFKFDTLFQKAKTFSSERNSEIKIPMHSLGKVASPHKAFFGYIEADYVAELVKNFGNSLFEQNVRNTLHNSDVNEAILETIKTRPHDFWYFNNGITAIASEVSSSASVSDPRTLSATALNIVNGAQTAGMIARASEEGIDLREVRVQMRKISLEGAPAGLDEEITRANNTQNELNALDFVSLDPRQDLLKNEIANLGFDYTFKRGVSSDSNLPIIEVKDAAIALACAVDDISVSVQAKRYVSGLWKDITAPPYTVIFHQAITGDDVLQAWKIFKTCEEELASLRQESLRQDASILSHGDRFVAHCVFSLIQENLVTGVACEVKKASRLIGKELVACFHEIAEGTYPATAFKNQKTQERLKISVLQNVKNNLRA